MSLCSNSIEIDDSHRSRNKEFPKRAQILSISDIMKLPYFRYFRPHPFVPGILQGLGEFLTIPIIPLCYPLYLAPFNHHHPRTVYRSGHHVMSERILPQPADGRSLVGIHMELRPKSSRFVA
jgi:hypothetical protein